jgi:hypothetical protein
MSWEIFYWEEEISTPTGLISAQADEKARAVGYEEGCSGLTSPIRWTNKEFKDRDEAMEYVNNAHKQYYCRDVDCNIAVKYRVYPKITSKTLESLKEQLVRRKEARVKCIESTSIAKRTSKLIGCKVCGSNLSREVLVNKHQEHCICGADLRSDTDLKRIEQHNLAITDLEKRIKEEEKKLEAKIVKQSTWRWLIKFSCHS